MGLANPRLVPSEFRISLALHSGYVLAGRWSRKVAGNMPAHALPQLQHRAERRAGDCSPLRNPARSRRWRPDAD
jgi:hypothetical protein